MRLLFPFLAIFNYAVKYYDLPKNPCTQAGSMGKGKAEEMNFWTQEEFETFVVVVKDKPVPQISYPDWKPPVAESAPPMKRLPALS